MMRLLRCLRLDPSDTFVFPRAAEPGEWAVPGSAMFWGADPADLLPKERAAFRAGFLGTTTLGFSTLVEIAEIAEHEVARVVEAFADQLLAQAGAPDREAALAASRDEVAFAQSLCDGPAGTVIAMHRTVEDGAVREQFRTLQRREGANPGGDRMHAYARAFEFVEVEEPEERVDLLGMMGKT
ncbi:MAG TPA: DUF6505 family protein [Microvirga sp.]|jgi:hypothetical protein|nr:DUF6505 family protein [Microvirga sp.]